jgi:phosphatidylglycerophosphate synthase
VNAGGRLPLAKPSDGPVSLLFNRPISHAISGPLAGAGVSPNAATLISLAIGIAGGVAYALGVWWLGGLLVQGSSVFAGVDGEIARRTDAASRFGDFLDTVADRFVEYLTFVAIGVGLTRAGAFEAWAWPLVALAIGGSFMLASASEKYRSVMHENYPKRQYEAAFAYLVSGRDVRVFYLFLLSLGATWRVDVLFWGLVAKTALVHLNYLYRIVILRGRMAG